MLKKQIIKLISEMTADGTGDKIELYKEEKEYIEKNQLLPSDFILVEKDSAFRFADAYIERSDKETEEVIDEEGQAFLNQPIDYLKKQMNEFIYLESNWMELIGVDSVSLEVDDVFRTYDVMLGLKLQKKFESNIKNYLMKNLNGNEANYDLMFSQDDGLWNLNIELNSIEGFHDDMTIGRAFQFIYQFLFKLVEEVEETK
ncbi:branched-chain amino acid aminotransferase [Bacillus sp. CGMCC 1.16607]|uniref:branched-chain amino acid aminotransferase n=1 Tax=Bacillus sp. CGMCC 1.16607 TaxID=3351842 RepID=UPI00362663E3